MKIREIAMPASKYRLKCPYPMKPTRIVVHNTANDASAANEIKYMQSNSKQVSFHFAVDDREIVQGVPLNRNAWHAGDGGSGKGNREGIAIEICYSKSGGSRFMSAEDNAAEFVAYLLTKYGWGIDRVTKHQDYSGKYCPHRTLDLGWDRFLAEVKVHMTLTGTVAAKPTFKKGDTVMVINTIKKGVGRPRGKVYSGGTFAVWYDHYTILSIQGDRAVIGVDDVITAAVHTDNLQKV